MALSIDLEVTLVTMPCPGCWGQRVIYHLNDDATYDKCLCGQCLGLGEITRTETTLTPQETDTP